MGEEDGLVGKVKGEERKDSRSVQLYGVSFVMCSGLWVVYLAPYFYAPGVLGECMLILFVCYSLVKVCCHLVS